MYSKGTFHCPKHPVWDSGMCPAYRGVFTSGCPEQWVHFTIHGIYMYMYMYIVHVTETQNACMRGSTNCTLHNLMMLCMGA